MSSIAGTCGGEEVAKLSEVEIAPSLGVEASFEETLQEFPGGHSQPSVEQSVFVSATGTFVEEQSESDSKPLRTTLTTKDVGIEQHVVEPPPTIVETVKPFLKRIQSKVDGTQDIAVGYDGRTQLRKHALLKKSFLGQILVEGWRPGLRSSPLTFG